MELKLDVLSIFKKNTVEKKIVYKKLYINLKLGISIKLKSS